MIATVRRSSRAGKQNPFLRLAYGLLELAVAYWLILLAINSGSIWQYLLAFALGVMGLRNLLLCIRKFIGGSKRQTTKA